MPDKTHQSPSSLDPRAFAPLRQHQPEVANLPRKPLTVGAATIVWALVHPELEGQGGRFLEDCGFSEVNPDPRLPNGVMPWALDENHAEAVWALSERLVGEKFGGAGTKAQSLSSAPPSSSAVASGLSVNRRAGTEQLRGHKLEITLEANGEVALDFLADGNLRWRGLPGFALDTSGTCAVDVVEAAPEVLLIVVMLPARGRETMSIVLDQATHHALFIASRLGEDTRPFERKTRVTQRFTNGRLRGSQPLSQFPPPMPTRDLIGTRAIYRYSEDTVYEHIYLNSRWYTYQCLKGMLIAAPTRPAIGRSETAVNKLPRVPPSIAWCINSLECRSAPGPHAD